MGNLSDNVSELNRYYGFDLHSVCWGYRDIFQNAIEGLYRDGLLGEGKENVTKDFFALLKNADKCCYDHVLKEFLCSLNPRTRWVLDIPSVFSDVTETGRLLSEHKIYHGIGFFKILGEGGFGDSPAKARFFLTSVRRLLQINGELAYAFVQGYQNLCGRLTPLEIEKYIQEALTLHAKNPQAGTRFMAAQSKASETIIRMLTRESRLEDEAPSLTALLGALVGYEVAIDDLGKLESDDLIERGTNVVCLYQWLYLPRKIRYFQSIKRNRDCYRLCTIIAAAMLSERTFSCIHGHPDFTTCIDLVGSDISRINLFMLLEYTRAVRAAKRYWPGARRLIDFGIRTEFESRQPECRAESLLQEVLLSSQLSWAAQCIIREADTSINTFDSAERLVKKPLSEIVRLDTGLGARIMRAYAFFPDFLYPGEVSVPPGDSMVADLKEDAKRNQKNKPKDADDKISGVKKDTGDGHSDGDETSEKAIPARYWYHEWNQSEGDFYENWCGVIQETTESRGKVHIPLDLHSRAVRVQRIFEQLKPDISRTERNLETGDTISIERLVSYRVNKRFDPDPPVDYYEKPMIVRRDLAVLILLDVSGSTGESAGDEKVIDIEKNASVILGQGLASLGDRFGIMGFSSNGREQCRYFVYKDFDDEWSSGAIERVMSAFPGNSTRMGAALRHSGWLLSQVETKQKLILLITDGKPMDTGYDPNSRYAQHDVRMACEENERRSITTFAISTTANSSADMEIMFSRKRYVIMQDIRFLPRVLPRLYMRLTL